MVILTWKKLVKIFDSYYAKFFSFLEYLKVDKMIKNFLRLQKVSKVSKKPKVIFLLASIPQMQLWTPENNESGSKGPKFPP